MVKVSAKAAVNAYLEVDYNVQSAGWNPIYDLRAENISNPVQLNYKANVYQTTGEDWDKVKLSLSTGNPSQSGTKPYLSTWYLDFYRNSDYGNKYYKEEARSRKSSPMVAADEELDMMEISEEPSSLSDYVSVRAGQTTVTFDISIPYSVPATGKKYLVDIQKHTLPAVYEYHCVPKLDKDAFLMARVSGWEEYNLLPGNMNLYFEGKYVGKSYLNTSSTKDTIDLSLGRDKSIIVTREKLKDFSEKKVIGTNKKETIGWEIAVRNNKRQKIAIRIDDQIPVSSNNDIEIEKIELTGADIEENTGKITWKHEMNPGENKKMKFVYSVKYPKGQTVNLE